MFPQATFVPECFITYITAISTLTSMYTMMYLQTTHVPKCFMAHVTLIWVFYSVYLLLKRKKGVIYYFKKSVRHYEMQVTKLVTQESFNKTRVLYQFPLTSTNVADYGMLAIYESNALFPVKRH